MNSPLFYIQKYTWTGKNNQGVIVTGETEALTPTMVREELKLNNIEPIEIIKRKKHIFTNEYRIKPVDVLLFTRHLSTLISSGTPLIKAIDCIALCQKNPAMRSLLTSIKTGIENGNSLASSLKRHTKVFDAIYCNLIHAAEESGTLSIMLKRIADHLEKSLALKRKMKQALTYPILIMVICLIVITILLIVVVPQFQSIFNSFNAPLPFSTQLIIQSSQCLKKYWWAFFAVTYALLYSVKFVAKHSTRFRLIFFGALVRKAIISRVSRILATSLSAGIPLVDALVSASNNAGNTVYQKGLLDIRSAVMTGQSFHTAISNTHLFPIMATQMLAVGEESGTVEIMLEKIANYYEDEVDDSIKHLSHLVEPIIMLVVGIIVGCFVIGLYLPLFQLGALFK